MNYLRRKLAKQSINTSKKKLSKYKKEKLNKNEEKERIRLIEAIWTMTDMIEIEEDDGTLTTIQNLKEKSTEELISLMEQMIEEAEKNL